MNAAEYVALPIAMLDSHAYRRLPRAAKVMLIDLYVMFHDVDTFTIDTTAPDQYRQFAHTDICKLLRELINSEFLKVVEMRHFRVGGQPRRVFRFGHQTMKGGADVQSKL